MNSMLLFVMVIIFQLNEIDSADSACQSCPQNLTASNHLIAGSELGRFAFTYSNDSSNNCLQANIICGFFIKKRDQQQVAEIFVNDIDNVLYQINGFTEAESAAEFVCDNNNHWIYYYSATNQFRIRENSIQCVIVTSSADGNRILIGDANNATAVAKKIVSPKFVAHDDSGHRSHHHHRHRQLPKPEQKHDGWGYGWGYGRDLSDGGYRSYANRRYNSNGFGYSASGDSRADKNRIDKDESNSDDDDDQQRRDDKSYIVIDPPRVERKSSNSHDDDQPIQIVLKSDELSSASASSELRSSSNSIQQQSSSSSGSDSHRFSSKSSSSASTDRSCRFASKSSSAECKNKNRSSAPQIVSNCLQSASLEKSIIQKAICQRRFRLFAKTRKHPLYSLA